MVGSKNDHKLVSIKNGACSSSVENEPEIKGWLAREILDVGKQKVLRFLKATAFSLANSRTLCEQQDTY